MKPDVTMLSFCEIIALVLLKNCNGNATSVKYDHSVNQSL